MISYSLSDISMLNTKVAVLGTLEEYLVGVKLLPISYQAQELMTFLLIKTFLQKENIACQILRTAWLGALGLRKGQMCFWINRLRDQGIIEFLASLVIIVRKRLGKRKNGIRRTRKDQSKRMRQGLKARQNNDSK